MPLVSGNGLRRWAVSASGADAATRLATRHKIDTDRTTLTAKRNAPTGKARRGVFVSLGSFFTRRTA
ncbi:hypothetical protein [Paraburkholderia tagetis]|uniref:Uncharacterized protein n=1 Tax=Paraburkholderia tagetis TaxID=2913261 RepID=A0A9X1UFV1_9BURK|nr:hypothetical protein [Paraburkholderia tagetis]MCG5074740.1 hypothetical protein [Paraburkholderia tagetis]